MTEKIMNPESMFRPRRFGHSNVFISDVHRTMNFYRVIAGLEECFQEPAIKAGFMGNGNTHHDVGLTQVSDKDIIGRDNQLLVPAGFGRHPGLFHLAFEVENEAELVEGYEKAVKSGVRILMTVDHTLAKSVYLLDPEGNVLELTSDSTTDWRTTFREHAGKLVTGPWSPGEVTPSTEKFYKAVNTELSRVPEAQMHSLRTTHAAVACRDLPKQLSFYKEVIGLRDAFAPQPGLAVLKGTAASFSLVLFACASGSKHGFHHAAFEVTEADMDSAETRLRAVGVPIAETYSDKTKRSVLVHDPDGLGVEFFASKGEFEPPQGKAAKAFWMVAA
jgi:catechol 2,3-dioxygenase